MKPQPLLPLTATALSLLPATASAWTFTWRDANGTVNLQNSHKPQPCTEINQAKDAQFDFHPESDPYSFYVWANNNCSGDPQGYSPILWRHNASRDLRSYLVDYGDNSGPVWTATTGSTATTETGGAVISTGSSAATATPTDGGDGGGRGGGGGGLSGGAIAGIVIGVVAAFAILGALFFFLGRRKRQNAAAAEAATGPAPPAPVDQQQGGPGGGAAAATSQGYGQEYFSEKKDAFAEKGPVELPHANQVSEMSNSHTVVEMSNSHSVVEMDASQRLNELEAPYRPPHH